MKKRPVRLKPIPRQQKWVLAGALTLGLAILLWTWTLTIRSIVTKDYSDVTQPIKQGAEKVQEEYEQTRTTVEEQQEQAQQVIEQIKEAQTQESSQEQQLEP